MINPRVCFSCYKCSSLLIPPSDLGSHTTRPHRAPPLFSPSPDLRRPRCHIFGKGGVSLSADRSRILLVVVRRQHFVGKWYNLHLSIHL